jgi:hypothetical protein
MTSPGVNSRWRAPYLDSDQTSSEVMEGGTPTWTMTSTGVNSGWRAPFVDQRRTFFRTSYLDMASPRVNSRRRAPYLENDQPFSEVWKEDLLPER